MTKIKPQNTFAAAGARDFARPNRTGVPLNIFVTPELKGRLQKAAGDLTLTKFITRRLEAALVSIEAETKRENHD